MVGNLKSKKQSGFTIIEVLIVLAIAGLIMLIVFLAVPALQRNSRNTQRKNDVQNLLGAVQEVLNNNNSAMSSITNANVVTAAPTPAYYVYSSTNPAVGSGANAALSGTTATDTVAIRTGATCNGGAAVAGTTRQIAIQYAVETGSGITALCTNS